MARTIERGSAATKQICARPEGAAGAHQARINQCHEGAWPGWQGDLPVVVLLFVVIVIENPGEKADYDYEDDDEDDSEDAKDRPVLIA